MNVVGMSYMMLKLVAVKFSESDCPFTLTGECEMDSCSFMVKRVIEDSCG